MANNALIPFLVAMMLVTGVCNTILNKFQDMQCVRNCDSPDPAEHKLFEQPVIQTVQMFIGEMGCWLVILISYVYRRYISPRLFRETAPLLSGGYRPVGGDDGVYNEEDDRAVSGTDGSNLPKSSVAGGPREQLRGRTVLLLAIPACCDLAGTTLMNVGLLFVAASVYQMTRGALVLFVGLFSVIFLRRKLYAYQWIALFVVVLGVALVGLAGSLSGDQPEKDVTQEGIVMSHNIMQPQSVAQSSVALRAVTGVFLIAAAQIFTASQFVLEEWILENYAMDPLQAVGWEGVFGFSATVIGMIILYLAVGRTKAGRYGYFDTREGLHEVLNNRAVAVSSILIMISIGGFNFFGLSVTRTVSATSRSTIDTCRTLFIWLVSLGLGWESFKWLQVLGFALLVYGTFLFNNIIRPPLKACLPRDMDGGRVLLEEEPVEHM